MKKLIPLVLTLALALVALAACSSGSGSASSASAESAGSSASAEAAIPEGIVIDEAAKTVTIPAVASGKLAEPSIHFLVNESGSNAEKAYFTTSVTTREVYDALEKLGAKHGDNIAVDDTKGTIEGSDLDMAIIVDGASYTPSDLVSAGDDSRPAQPRFGGNIEANEEFATGCIFCMESCSLGITSNAAYEYTEPADFVATDAMPAAGTEAVIVYTLK